MKQQVEGLEELVATNDTVEDLVDQRPTESDYERERTANMSRNNAVLESLGLQPLSVIMAQAGIKPSP